MKYTLHIDPDREEEIVIYARAKTPEVEALIGYVDRMNTELLGYGEGEIIPLSLPLIKTKLKIIMKALTFR